MKRDTAEEFNWQPFRNSSGERIPAHAVIAIDGEHEYETGFKVLNAVKPSSSEDVVYAINAPVGVPTSGPGNCSSGFAKRVLYDTGSTPTPGQEWGPESGSWKIHPDGEGFTIVGGAEDGTVRVKPTGGGGGGGGTTVGYAWVVEDVHKAINTMATTDRTPGNVIVTGEMSLGGEVPADTDDPSEDGTLAIQMIRKYTEDPTGIPNWELIYYAPPPEHPQYEEIKLYGFVGVSTKKDRSVAYAVIDGKRTVIAEDCY